MNKWIEIMEEFSVNWEFIIEVWYFWLIIALAFIYKIFKPYIKGFFGEKQISMILSYLPKTEYLIINNVMLKSKNGSTQIDHIVVSIYGVFVIETKNYKGWICGSENADQWTKNMYGKKYKFRNPIKQNYGHVITLKELLNAFGEFPIVPIVAFSPECDLKVKTKSDVVYFRGVKKVIARYKNEVLSLENIQKIYDTILSSNINSKENRKEHVKSIRNKVRNDKNKINDNICPRCGEKLVERSGKNGEFLGCSNYPKCRFTVTR